MSNIDNYQDIIDVRDIIARCEDLAASIDYCAEHSEVDPDEVEEFDALHVLLKELRGNGGDEQWCGDWYPVTLIRDSYFEEYAKKLAEDIGAISGAGWWPANRIDWERAASDLQIDYSSVEYNGVTYWYR